VVDPDRKMPDLKAEVGELRSGGIPSNLTPECNCAKLKTWTRNKTYLARQALTVAFEKKV